MNGFFIAEGFRSTTQIRDGLAKFRTSMSYNKSADVWEAILVRPLTDPYTKLYTDTFPVAFAVWDGAKLNRDGLKNISPWTAVKVEGGKGSDQISELLGTLNKDLTNADIKNGEVLAKANCAACHWFAEVKDAPAVYGAESSKYRGVFNYRIFKENRL